MAVDDTRWFLISPQNDVARAIVNDVRNRDCVILGSDGKNRINVTFDDYFKPDCLLSFGRERTCSVVCDPPGFSEEITGRFSRRHCRFFFHKSTLIIRDESSRHTTHIRPRQIDSYQWEFTDIPRQRAIPERGAWDLIMGPAEFCLEFPDEDGWWNRHSKEKKKLATRRVPTDSILTLPPTRCQTGVQTPRISNNKIRDPITYYELQDLGSGTFGRVSRVIDLQWGGILAVKIIEFRPEREKESKEILEREVELLAKLSHPNIIKFLHSQGGELGEPIEIFMTAADGSLRGLLDQKRSQNTKMTREQITHVTRNITSALYYLHEKNIIHRDIKPDNILFKDLSADAVFSLADFGLSKEIDANATFVGSPFYWAPEVLFGAPQDFRVDIWSFGVVIYEMITGLALDKLPGLTKHVCISGEWCRMLEYTCRAGGDVAKMLTLNFEERITIQNCHTSPTFPVLPDALPSPVIGTLAQAPPPISPILPRRQPRGQKNSISAQGRVNKARRRLGQKRGNSTQVGNGEEDNDYDMDNVMI